MSFVKLMCLWSFAAYFFVSCEQVNKLGLQSKEEAAVMGFAGVKSLESLSDGRYILQWEKVTDVQGGEYQIFMQKKSREESGSTTTQLLDIDDVTAPVNKGELLDTVSSVGTYTLTFVPEKNST